MDENVGLISDLKRVQVLLDKRAVSPTDKAENEEYGLLRGRLIADARLKHVMPQCLRTCRSLDLFWPYIEPKSGKWAERRQIINDELSPLFELLEGSSLSPSDHISGIKLEAFDKSGVHDVWLRALDRRSSDPDGAITLARTLLESTLKKILDEHSVAYENRTDLPKLWGLAANVLNLAPDNHSLEPIKAILRSGITLVNGLGTLRNSLGDAHGHGSRPVKPTSRHADLAVNIAGAVASFLVETNQLTRNRNDTRCHPSR